MEEGYLNLMLSHIYSIKEPIVFQPSAVFVVSCAELIY